MGSRAVELNRSSGQFPLFTGENCEAEFLKETREIRYGGESHGCVGRTSCSKCPTMEDISISDISAEALINRKTFYAHYASVHEIIAEIEDEITASLQKPLANYSKWLNMIRLEKATELLADKQLTLTETAMLSGFQSISSFNRVFREEKGMAPGEYRALLSPLGTSGD